MYVSSNELEYKEESQMNYKMNYKMNHKEGNNGPFIGIAKRLQKIE